MLGKKAKQLLWVIMFMVPTYPSTAIDKVVVISLGGDDAPTSKAVFVTKGAWQGNLGGPSGADAKCQAEADAPGSKVQGHSFKAWISGGLPIDFTAGTRVFTHSELPYKLVDGSLVTNDFADLVSGDALSSEIVTHPDGTQVQIFDYVWTGISSSGTFAIDSCGLWTATTGLGLIGHTGPLTNWTVVGADFCNSPHALYCFEQ
jgi:hypothetical protein